MRALVCPWRVRGDTSTMLSEFERLLISAFTRRGSFSLRICHAHEAPDESAHSQHEDVSQSVGRVKNGKPASR